MVWFRSTSMATFLMTRPQVRNHLAGLCRLPGIFLNSMMMKTLVLLFRLAFRRAERAHVSQYVSQCVSQSATQSCHAMCRPNALGYSQSALAPKASKRSRVRFMPTIKDAGAAPFVPELRTLPALRDAVQHCRGCDLYLRATQAVFGELATGTTAGTPKVRIMMIGEQPGDQEDKQGRPFVGPAGKLLDKCLEE